MIVNSKFTPFTYELRIKPLVDYTEAYNKMEDKLNELSDLTAYWRSLIANDPNEQLRLTYSDYEAGLNDAADRLALGLTPGSYKDYLKLRRGFYQNIKPIESAYQSKLAAVKNLYDLKVKDPTVRFNFDAQNASLVDFIKNPFLTSDSISGAFIATQMNTMAKTLADDLMSSDDNDTKSNLISSGLPYQWKERIQKGLTLEELVEFMQNPETNQVLYGMALQVLKTSGVEEWAKKYNDPGVMDWAWGFINQGVWGAQGTTTEERLTDQYGMNVALESQKLENSKELAKFNTNLKMQEDILKEQLKGKDAVNTIYSSGHSYFKTSGDLDKTNAAVNKLVFKDENGNFKFKASYFGKNGKANPMEIAELMQNINKEAEEAFFNNAKNINSGGSTSMLMAPIELDAARKAGIKIHYKSETNRGITYNAAPIEDINGVKYVYLTRDSYITAYKQRYKNSLELLGITSFLTDDEYKHLKELGFNGSITNKDGSLKNTNILTDMVDSRVKRESYYSIPMHSYDHISSEVISNLGAMDKGGYEFDTKTGLKGKYIDYDDMDLYSEEDNKKGRKVTSIMYDPNHPNEIILQIGSKGKAYLVDPAVLDENTARAIIMAAEYLNTPGITNEQRETITKDVISVLYGRINAFNKNKSGTDSEID